MPESIDDSGDGGGGVTEPRKLAARPKSPDVAPCNSSADDLSTAAVGSTDIATEAFPNATSSEMDPLSATVNSNFASSGSVSEHLTATTSSTSADATTITSRGTSLPSFSSSDIPSLGNSNIGESATGISHDNDPSFNHQHSTSSSIDQPTTGARTGGFGGAAASSRPSSFLGSKSRAEINVPRHAYFASSEEESEAELDEKDSHYSHSSMGRRSSRSSGYVHPMVAALAGRGSGASGGGKGGDDINRGRGRLWEIASKVSSNSPPPRPPKIARAHDATMPMTKKESGGKSKPVPSIYKTTGGRGGSAVPPPPQTVTVAVGKNNGSSSLVDDRGATANDLPSPTSHHPLQPSTSTELSENNPNDKLPAYAASPSRRKRLRRKHRRKRRAHHLPRGLPVFKDPRSCMWTSTYDANAPSEDRYSSLVNVLLRPPKQPRGTKKKRKLTKQKVEGEDNEKCNMAAANGSAAGGSGSGSGASGGGGGSNSEDDENAASAGGATREISNKSNAVNNRKDDGERDGDEEEDEENNTSLIRLSLWSVIDGHGGGCVATYAAEVLLPHIAASVARALKSEIVDRGVCNVNGQLRDANALDLDGLIRSSDRSRHPGKSQSRQREAGIDVINPNSIHYRSPYEDSESEIDDDGVLLDQGEDADHASRGTQGFSSDNGAGMRSESESEADSEAAVSVASSLLTGKNQPITRNSDSVASSAKTSVKTAVSPVTQHAPVGTHSPLEVASITRAITDSFLAVDEGWINSIDPVTTHQTSCVSNGRWNAGACALVVFIIQRLDWCRSSHAADIDDDIQREIHDDDEHLFLREQGARGFPFEDTLYNKDAARRRKLDSYAKKCKSVSSLSTLSSTSSITTEANTTELLVEDSEITETDDDEDDVSDIFGPRIRRRRKKKGSLHMPGDDYPHHPDGGGFFTIATPASCDCHYYRPRDAMLYTAHVGDCRAVMLGSAPPRTIKVPPEGNAEMSLSMDHSDRSEAESETSSNSESVADEISSCEGHIDSDSSDGEDMMMIQNNHILASGTRRSSRHSGSPPGGLGYVGRGSSKRQRRNNNLPFVPLPPLSNRCYSSEESVVASDDSMSTTAQDEEGQQHRHLPPVGSIHTRRGSIGSSELLETEDEMIRSVRSGSPTQIDRPPSPTQLVADPIHPPPLPLSMLMRPIDLTTDHSAYNPAEVTAVLRRCNNAPKAISSASGGGIKRVAGSLAVTRALGDAYLKTPCLSFFPYKRHAPYISARPEVNCRVLTKGADRILTLASDGIWERASGDDVLRWVRNYYNARIAGKHDIASDRLGAESRGSDALGSSKSDSILREKAVDLTPAADNDMKLHEHCAAGKKLGADTAETTSETTTATITTNDETADSTATTKLTGTKRKPSAMDETSVSSHSTVGSSRGRGGGSRSASSRIRGAKTPCSSSHDQNGHHHHLDSSSMAIPSVSDIIVRKVLNKVRKNRNITMSRLLSLPKGRARRSKHDDITATVVDLSGFFS